jgi:NADH-quinone oxidoreductase subunit J
MMLNLGRETAVQEKQWLQPKVWAGPSVLAFVLLAQMVILLTKGNAAPMNMQIVEIKRVSVSLYGEYILALELAGFLLMAGIVGAAHIGKHKKKHLHRFLQEDNNVEEQFQKRDPVTIISEEKEAPEPVA